MAQRSLHNNLYLDQLIDSWVNTALLLVFQSGLTGLKTSWALLTIAAWLRLLPCLAWLKLYLRVFSQANPNLRSYLIDWPRCSLLCQSQFSVSVSIGLWTESDSLAESMNTKLIWLSLIHSEPCRLSLIMNPQILCSVDWAWLWVNEYWLNLLELNTALVVFKAVSPEGRHSSLTTPGPNIMLWSPISSVRSRISRRTPYLVKQSPTMKRSNT